MESMLRLRWRTLIEHLEGLKRVLVAYSGGCDSAFLVAAARKVLGRENVLAVTGVSASLPWRERREAGLLAERLDVDHQFLETDELNDPNYSSNPSNRCFFCKNELYGRLVPIAKARQMVIADGLNASDRADIRPGVQAALKWNVSHPLDAVNLSKHHVRTLSRWLGLPTWKKPASPCLSSRLPYGTAVTPKALSQIERAEDYLRDLGLQIVRVRHYGDEARIEVEPLQISFVKNEERFKKISTYFSGLGFARTTVDARGFKSGRLNEVV